jgi:cytochrome c oxidase assembly protein subunit 15
MNDTTHPSVPRWLHGWAILTVCVALPLIALGAEVTTKQVGMADKQAVREPWYLLTLSRSDMWAQGIGLVIEHSHRTAGWLVGICAIVLAVGMWFGARGTVVRAAGLLALLLVIIQGLLGIFRVGLHAWIGPEMAMVHGVFAQIAFATLVGVAVITSRSWLREAFVADEGRLRPLAAFLSAAAFVQIVFGAMVRHQHSGLAQRVHVLFAFVVAAAIVWLVREVIAAPTAPSIRRVAFFLAGILAVQLALGVEAWIRRFGAGEPIELVPSTPVSDLVRTAHFFSGAVLFAATVAINLLLYRPATRVVTAGRPVATLENDRIPARIGGIA